ncbi:MAG TPA: type II secretion system minor pseudopilin GspI [Steroidobacteraceae bacterium]|nr:type II secretion system minor pseudopilin GspI [Steroidobacteraceae bacterium]
MRRVSGFTLIEVLVALVIVAFGMSAVLAALSSSADNISALREKSLAEWIAMNRIADERLNLNPPKPGFTEGDLKGFGNEDWHWREDVVAVDAIPGMLEIAVRVAHLKPGQTSFSSGSSTSSKPTRTASGFSGGAPGSFFSSSGYSSGSYSSGGFSSGLGGLSSSLKNLGASALPVSADTQWVATVIGFRGDAVSPASGEQPDWTCSGGGALTASGLCNISNTQGASSSGATINQNTGQSPGSQPLLNPTGSPTYPPSPAPIGSSAGGTP